jgi:phospholipase D1/2
LRRIKPIQKPVCAFTIGRESISCMLVAAWQWNFLAAWHQTEDIAQKVERHHKRGEPALCRPARLPPSMQPIANSSMESAALLQPGRNCWRIEPAERMAMLVDAADYFRCVREAIVAARHTVFILSWDVDTRMRLMPGGADDGYPEPLGEFLHAIVAERPALQVYVLNWDFAMLYALEREWLPLVKFGWRTHDRLHFALDAQHPIGGSHHQKIVVVDDALAFVGGLDLTRSRWDTPGHSSNAPLRHDPDGTPFGPFHDVQAMVDGEAARALGVLCRLRWLQAKGQAAVGLCEERHERWPTFVEPDLCDLTVAISRTEPAYQGRPGVHEVRRLHLDAIAGAKKHLFFESQYFTSGLIAEALGQRLLQDDAPDVVVVSPETQSGWLEEATMGVLRSRMQRKLDAADRHRRYRLYFPYLPDLHSGCLNVHSKVFTMDDRLLSIGSANLSSRSMAADTECNLTIEACGDPARQQRIAAAIARMRARLLGEHLDVSPERVQQVVDKRGLIGAIESLQTNGRSLRQVEVTAVSEIDALIPEKALFDPERPIDPDKLVSQFVPEQSREPIPRRAIALVLLACGLILLALSWRFTPLREWINLTSLVGFARALDDMPFTPLAVIACYVVGGLAMFPVTLLIAVTGIVFGPWWGGCYALAGALLSASVSYSLGAWLGRNTVHRLLGARVNGLSRRIARRGIVAMMVIRVVPVAPFTIVNVVAGASDIRFRDFMIGTLLGMLPGIAITVTFVHNLAEAVRRPSTETIATLAALAVLMIIFAFILQRLLTRHQQTGVQ